MQMAKRYIKRCSALLIIREMQTTATGKYRLTLLSRVIVAKNTENSCW